MRGRLKRVFNIDIETCSACGGDVRIIASIEDPVVIQKILAHHGWIPEAVHTTSCVTPGRKTLVFDSGKFGQFTFHPMAVYTDRLLELVQRIQITQQTMLVADPVRALMDLVCLRKIQWQGLGWLIDGMRIDENLLRSTKPADLTKLMLVYKQKRVNSFLKSLVAELNRD